MKSPFIALINDSGGVVGYVRADRIEAVSEAPSENGVARTRGRTFSGAYFLTGETLDDVFAKMADALHVPMEEETHATLE